MVGGAARGTTQPAGELRWLEAHWVWGELMTLLPGRQTLPLLSELALLQPIDVVGELEGRPQFQTHVLHHHVAAQ